MHCYQTDYQLLKWQLSSTKNLVPMSYNSKPLTGIFRYNIENDVLSYFNKTTIAETFQVGFGDLCWIHDQMIKPINRLIKNEREEVPTAIKRFPKPILQKYYPKIFSGNFTFFDYTLAEVGDCNKGSPEKKCKPMPESHSFMSTANGRRQMHRFLIFDGWTDTSVLALYSENRYYEFMVKMAEADYCSPYVY